MTEIARASGAPVIRQVNGTAYEFPSLTRAQIGELIALWVAQDRERLIRMMAEAKLDPTGRMAALKEFDRESRSIAYAYRSLYEFTRSAEVLEKSRDSGVDGLPFTPDEMVGIASELWGLTGESDAYAELLKQCRELLLYFDASDFDRSKAAEHLRNALGGGESTASDPTLGKIGS